MYDMTSVWNRVRDKRNQHLLTSWYGSFKMIVYWGDSIKDSMGVSTSGSNFQKDCVGKLLTTENISIPA